MYYWSSGLPHLWRSARIQHEIIVPGRSNRKFYLYPGDVKPPFSPFFRQGLSLRPSAYVTYTRHSSLRASPAFSYVLFFLVDSRVSTKGLGDNSMLHHIAFEISRLPLAYRRWIKLHSLHTTIRAIQEWKLRCYLRVYIIYEFNF